MAMNLWYKIPFQSQLKTNYELRIYKEGTPTSVLTLRPGAVPFVTDEDETGDFFAPVRTQTGSISVIYEPSTTFRNVDEFMNAIMPASNISSPVELVKIEPLRETVVWQGFLNSEAYTQNYISIAQEISIPVLSVLAAMDSVPVTTEAVSGIMTVGSVIQKVINQMEATCKNYHDNYRYDYFYVPSYYCGFNILTKYIDTIALFEQKEYTNENSVTYVVSGLSCLEILRRLCAFMGWTCREQGRSLYITDAKGEEEIIFSRRGAYYPNKLDTIWYYDGAVDIDDEHMSDLQFRGTDHKVSIAQGAKSVEVVAKLEKYNLSIGIPPCPTGDLATVYGRLYRYTRAGDEEYILANKIANAYSNITFANYSAMVRYWYFHFEQYATATLANVLNHMAVGTNSVAKREILHGDAITMLRWYAGAFLARYCWEPTGGLNYHDVKDALYCVFFPHSLNYQNNPSSPTDFSQSSVGAIFSIDSVVNYRCNSGYLKLNAKADPIYQWPAEGDEETAFLRHDKINYEWFVSMELSVGAKWWNGSSWQGTQCTFKARFLKDNFKKNWVDTMPIAETDGLLIPVGTELFGVVTLKIWPQASPMNYSESNTAVLEMIFDSLDVTHIIPSTGAESDRGENKYFRLLGTNFSDEKSVSVDFASSLNNAPSPSLIMEDATTAMTKLDYGIPDYPNLKRPEVDLLDKLDVYYSLPRKIVKLECKEPATSPLPLLRLEGFDGKNYMPLANSRDWQQEKNTITCFEGIL